MDLEIAMPLSYLNALSKLQNQIDQNGGYLDFEEKKNTVYVR